MDLDYNRDTKPTLAEYLWNQIQICKFYRYIFEKRNYKIWNKTSNASKIEVYGRVIKRSPRIEPQNKFAKNFKHNDLNWIHPGLWKITKTQNLNPKTPTPSPRQETPNHPGSWRIM